MVTRFTKVYKYLPIATSKTAFWVYFCTFFHHLMLLGPTIQNKARLENSSTQENHNISIYLVNIRIGETEGIRKNLIPHSHQHPDSAESAIFN